jgi:hypothetical protein
MSAHVRVLRLALAACLLCPIHGAAAQLAAAEPTAEGVALRKAELEAQKLALEVAKLKAADSHDWSAIVAFLGGIGGTALTWWIARRTRHGEHDKTVHEKRLAAYPTLVETTAPLAIFFPHTKEGLIQRLDQAQCGAMGRALSNWYFKEGALLVSPDARDSYFRYITALARASRFDGPLSVPTHPDDTNCLDVELIDQYRSELEATLDLNAVGSWEFGTIPTPHESAQSNAYRLKDYVFLQRLSSALRTALAEDLKSRRRPC